jgi:hypothetical protein
LRKNRQQTTKKKKRKGGGSFSPGWRRKEKRGRGKGNAGKV